MKALAIAVAALACDGGKNDNQAPDKSVTPVEKHSPTKEAKAPGTDDGGPDSHTAIRALKPYPSEWGGKWFDWDALASLKTQELFVLDTRAVLCKTRAEAEREKCESRATGGTSWKGKNVTVVGDAPFDGHWRALWDSEGPDGAMASWVRAERLGKTPGREAFVAFDREKEVLEATLANEMSAEEIAKLPKDTLLVWRDVPAPRHLGVGTFFPADPARGAIAYLPTKGGKPVGIKFYEDVNAKARKGEATLYYEHACILYGGCNETSYLCPKDKKGHCDTVSILARTLGGRRTGPPIEGVEKRIPESYPKQWRRYFMPALDGVLLADRNGLHRFPLVGEEGLPAPGTVPKIEILNFNKRDLHEEYKASVDIVHGEHYRDGWGEGWLVVSKRQESKVQGDSTFVDTYLTIDHLRGNRGGEFALMRRVKAQLKACQEPGALVLDRSSVEVLDLDQDGVAEVQVGYGMQCGRNNKGKKVVGYDYKLMLLEKGDKFIIRGAFEQTGRKHKVVLQGVLDDALTPPPFRIHLERSYMKFAAKAARSRWSEIQTDEGIVPSP